MGQTASMILINGPGGQGRVILDAALALGLTVTGVLDDGDASSLGGLPVTGKPASWAAHLGSGRDYIVALGNQQLRRQLGEEILAAGGRLVSVVHPGATVSARAKLGRGVFIAAGCVIGPEAVIGDFSILNASCAVDHDCVLGIAVQFGPGVTLAGGITVDDGAFLGVCACVLPEMRIGANAIVGGGAVVTRPVEAGATVVGNPARPLTR